MTQPSAPPKKHASKAPPRIRRLQAEARRAARAGNIAVADGLARRALTLAAQTARIEKAASIGVVAPTRTGPVLLDPKGFSPSGIPNWLRNQQRLARAGIRTPPQR
ncbi:MAG: hypothetical protein R3C46_06515 [Hyphomonadaceae bacterium]